LSTRVPLSLRKRYEVKRSRKLERDGRFRDPRWSTWWRYWKTIVPYSHRFVGHLPQGAATSPMLSNMVSKPLDEALLKIAESRDLVVTRYADDITFSTSLSSGLDRKQARRLIAQVRDAVLLHGFRLQTRKSVVVPPTGRKVVLGLLVDRRDRPRLTREFRRTLEQHIYGVSHHGVAQHATHRGFPSILAMRRYLQGLLNHASQVDPTWAENQQRRFESADWPA